jgi:hypothetical protein
MPSVAVDVNVTNGGVVVDLLKARPVRLIPSGHAGVVFAGDVFPLRKGNLIRLEDERFSRSECSRYVPISQPIPYFDEVALQPPVGRLHVGRWNVENNRFGNYLVFDADEETAGSVAELMERVGLGVIRWDSSYRPSFDGYQYDWFVRLEFAGSREDAYARIEHALKETAAGPPTSGFTFLEVEEGALEKLQSKVASRDLEITRLAKIIEGLFASIDEWQSAHEELTSRAAKLDEDLAKSETSRRELTRQLGEEQRNRAAIEATSTTLELVRDELRVQRSSALADEILLVQQDADERIVRAEEDRRVAEELGEEAEQKAASDRSRLLEIQAELAAKDAEISRLVGENESLESQIIEVSSAEAEKEKVSRLEKVRRGSSGRTSADRFAVSVLSRLTFHDDGLETLVTLKDPSKVFDMLFRLNSGETVPVEIFRGSAGKNVRVMEVKGHFHIGDEGKGSDLGRIYYAKEDDRFLVYVHRKKNDREQEQTVERFASWCRRQLDA